MLKSLKLKMSLAVFGLMVVASTVLGVLLNAKFKRTLMQSEKIRLENFAYAMLSLVEVVDDNTIDLDPLLLQASADHTDVQIFNDQGSMIWSSDAGAVKYQDFKIMEVGEWNFESRLRESIHKFVMSFGFSWVLEKTLEEKKFTLVLLDKGSFFQSEMRVLKQQWIKWLMIGSCITIFFLLLLVQWVLKPLKFLSEEVKAIESGSQDMLSRRYPLEVTPLISSLHSLLQHERGVQKRFRNTLDNLAHALKTPVAAMQTLFDNHLEKAQWEVDAQLQLKSIDSIIDYQLKKAAHVGHAFYLKSINILPHVQSVVSAVSKVYKHKSILFEVDVSPDIQVKIEEGDLLEVLGNLIENGAKYGRSKVIISCLNKVLSIEDDGQGVDLQAVEDILKRGVRLDQRVEGTGIGLAVVNDILTEYQGSITCAVSGLGGLRVDVMFL